MTTRSFLSTGIASALSLFGCVSGVFSAFLVVRFVELVVVVFFVLSPPVHEGLVVVAGCGDGGGEGALVPSLVVVSVLFM